MTHDELLARINDNNNQGIWIWANVKALRAVVELHKPYVSRNDEFNPWTVCDVCGDSYPCPTIQAIERELA